MAKSFRNAIKHRRTYYSICGETPVSDSDIEEMLEFALLNVPSAFNSQSTRIILLLGNNHRELWDIVMETLRPIVPIDKFDITADKINSFAAGYGTILYYEDQNTVQSLQTNFPLYAENFPVWSTQTSAMHQFAVWTMLEDLGFGASLQHYNPIIDDSVQARWNIPKNWKMIAQMPFGLPTHISGEKPQTPIADRLMVFK